MATTYPEVKTLEQFFEQPEEYQTSVKKIVRSHALNELYGAQVFDEPAIALAPTPQTKWVACRIAMEEYHHHLRFKALADQIKISEEEMSPKVKRPLNIFEVPLANWEEFCAIKLLGDLAEILQVEDLLHCSFVPLRNLARATMPEEKFHAQSGVDECKDIVKSDERRAKAQAMVDRFFPEALKFFGAPRSKNNELFRKYGLKQRTNEEMRADYIARASKSLESVGLAVPPLPAEAE